MTTNGIYHTLVTQLDKLAHHNRQGSFRTEGSLLRGGQTVLCLPLAVHYHLQKLETVSGKLIGRAMAEERRTTSSPCIWPDTPVCASTSVSVWTPPRRSVRCGKTPSP